MKLENKSKNNGIYNLEACCKRFQQTDYEKNNKINKECHTKGITLIALVVTIVVMLVLAGVSISLLTGDNGVITKAKIAKEAQVLSNYQENMNLFATDKGIESSNFAITSLTAYKNKLYYNTKQADDESGIEEVLGTIDDRYIEKMEIINGELCINTTNKREAEAANMAGIKVNPWDIENGVLLSSDKNLGLLGNLDTIVIPPSIKKIGSGAFSGVTNIKKVVIPGTVEEIGSNAFSNNTTLEEVTIEYGVKRVGQFAFKGCSSLRKIEFPDSITQIGGGVLQDCTNLTSVKLSENITIISSYFFSNCEGLTEVTITGKVNSIANYAFNNSGIKTINISDNVTIIEAGAFSNTENLEKINISPDNESFKFENGLLLSKDGKNVYFGLLSIKELVIPEGVKNIVADSFVGSNAISISLPDTVNDLQGVTFGGMNKLTEIKLNETNQNYKILNGNLLSKDGTKLILYMQDGDVVKIPEGVKIITNKAVRARRAKEIILPESLEEILGWGVSDVLGVTTINIPKNVKPFNSCVFGSITQITVDEENPYIKSVNGTMILSKDGKTLYAGIQGVSKFVIPETVEKIGSYSFYMSSNISSIQMNKGVKEIGDFAFGYGTLKSINIPSTVKSIGRNAFIECTKLTSVTINKTKDSIEGSPWGCPIGDRAIKWLK